MAVMQTSVQFQPGDLVKVRGREWVVLPGTRGDLLRLRPLGGSEDDSTIIYVPLELEPPVPASFDLPDPTRPGPQEAVLLLRDALRLKLRAASGPFRSFGNLAFEPRAYQLVPLLMALKLDPIRLLIADDVGIGKTIEAGLIAREMLDRGEITRFAVICPPHLCEQWQAELLNKFNIRAEIVRTGTATRLERGLRPDESIFDVYPFTVVSLDYIKSDRRRDEFLRACPEFVIVDEAHTCVQSNGRNRHQRYKLLKGIAESVPSRHMVFLTATPHSGDDVAFYNLLGLIHSKFSRLIELPEGAERQSLRNALANHLVQRRRGDIAEWQDNSNFPIRQSAEATYHLTGKYGDFFHDVLQHARDLVKGAEGKGQLERRMSWWAALALLRCVSSSPAAAALALQTRLRIVEGLSEEQQIDELDATAAQLVLDGGADDIGRLDESVPAGIVSTTDVSRIRELIERAEEIRGPQTDSKLTTLIQQVKNLLNDRFKPVVFCRYIATAHYVAEHLSAVLPPEQYQVVTITGELPSDQREELVEQLHELPDHVLPVLVATDCLSEGINLQEHFDAVIHYDLSWNPTRHEQREGRVDRFGQRSKIVRTLMIYGEDNPIDGAVLRVILRKAEKIQRELGVTVPLPLNNDKVIDAIMTAVLLHSGDVSGQQLRLSLDFGDTETEVEAAWESVKNKVTRTVFAQRRIDPDLVLPEWNKTTEILGSQDDVERFVRTAALRLGAPLEERGNTYRFPIEYLPRSIRDRLAGVGITKALRIAFRYPAPDGAHYIHRAHPLVGVLAEFIVEQTLEYGESDVGARCTAIFTRAVQRKTVVYLLRLRNQLLVEQRTADGKFNTAKVLLTEECVGVAVEGSGSPRVLKEADALALLAAEPGKNMDPSQQARYIQSAITAISHLGQIFEQIAHQRAQELLDDHRRIRDAGAMRGVRYSVRPSLPVDTIGVYVLVPVSSL
jgi:superfamily II DNA or RNA helicase